MFGGRVSHGGHVSGSERQARESSAHSLVDGVAQVGYAADRERLVALLVAVGDVACRRATTFVGGIHYRALLVVAIAGFIYHEMVKNTRFFIIPGGPSCEIF